ncbi:MAG: nitroreductase family protein [Armatimonadota bacterium]|nr:nitroreductase family protein [bacterium]
MLKDIVLANRSYRRFVESEHIDKSTLRELVDLARCSASGGNLQSLKYILSCTPEKNDLVFPATSWASYFTEWPGPDQGERPSAYIVILGDTSVSKNFFCDHGIAAQSILLGAAEKGLGGCMIGSINRDLLRQNLGIPETFEILLIIALGKPAEKVVLENVGPDGSIKYHRDADGVHHVPKRALDDIILTDCEC